MLELLHRELDVDVRPAGVPNSVGQRLLRDPVRGQLDGGRQPRLGVARAPGAPSGCRPRPSRSACSLMAASSPSSSSWAGRSPSTSSGGRDHRGLQVDSISRSSRWGLRIVLLDQARRETGLQGETGQGRAELVVQIRAQPAALLLADADQPAPSRLELVGEVHRADHGHQLHGQGGEDLPVTGEKPARLRGW